MSRIGAITQGSRVRSRSWGRICVTESVHPPNVRLEPHRHLSSCLTYVLDGDFLESVEGREYYLRRGAVLLKRSDAIHANEFGSSGARSLLIEVPHALLARFESGDVALEFGASQSIPGASLIVRRIHDELLEPDAVSPLVVEGLLLDVLSQAARCAERYSGESAPPSWLARVRELLDESYANPPTLGHLGREAGVHPDHLGRAFRQHYGATPGAYVRRIRLERAVHLIVTTDRPLAEIAYRTGFSDQSHMTRQVRAKVGVTPGRLRDTA